uniref:Uncharacterized protein n=1 Tax=Anopheles quadriannulatus TaxID=34691 RepID=A0A182XPQ7_ANOQN
MPTLERALAIVNAHNGIHFVTHEGKQHKIAIEMVDDATEVKVRDLPPGIPDADVVAELGGFGEVLTIVPGVWGSETRLAGMPSGSALNWLSQYHVEAVSLHHITYHGSHHHCNEAVHHGLSCIQNRECVTFGTTKNHTLEPYGRLPHQQKLQLHHQWQALTLKDADVEESAAQNAAPQRPAGASKIANRLVIPIVPVSNVRPSSPKPNKIAKEEQPQGKANFNDYVSSTTVVAMHAAVTSATASAAAPAAAPSAAPAAAPVAAPAAAAAVAAAAAPATAPAASAAASSAASAAAAAADATALAATAHKHMRVDYTVKMFKVLLKIPSSSFPICSLDEQFAVKRKQFSETDNESDAS